jgi:fibronectin type 3 domain-containing protein
MKRVPYIVFLIILMGFVSPLINAQDVLTFFDGYGIHLRWKGVQSPYLEAYNVYRQNNNNGQWILLNDKPLTIITSGEEINRIAAHKSAMFLALFGIDNPDADISIDDYTGLFSNPESASFLEVICLVNPELGELLGELFYDSTIVVGEEYIYKVEALVEGQIIEVGRTGSIETLIAENVPDITEIIGKGLDEKIVLSWERNRDLLSSGKIVTYNVYRSDKLLGPYRLRNLSGILPVSISSGNSSSDNSIMEYSDDFLDNGKTYYYFVKAVNAFGLESSPSITLEVVAGSDMLPSPPNALKARLVANKIHLGWDMPKEVVEGFEIYKSVDGSESFDLVYPLTDLFLDKQNKWIDFSVMEGHLYRYYLKSINNGHSSSPSDTIEFFYRKQSPPSEPSSVKAEIISGQITIRWHRNPESTIIGYEVERSSDDEFNTRFLLTSSPVKDTFYVDILPAQSQTTYAYVVYAVDDEFRRSMPSVMVKAKMPDIRAPQSPILSGLERDRRSVLLYWGKLNDIDSLSFRVYQSFDHSDFELIGESDLREFRTDLRSSGYYRFAVAAVDKSNNESELSNVLDLRYDADKYPGTPVKAKGKINKDKQLELSWAAPGGSKVIGYLITRINSENESINDIADLPADKLEFTDITVVKGKTYIYEIRAYNTNFRMSVPAVVSVTIK